jgi:hypothetical protein
MPKAPPEMRIEKHIKTQKTGQRAQKREIRA